VGPDVEEHRAARDVNTFVLRVDEAVEFVAVAVAVLLVVPDFVGIVAISITRVIGLWDFYLFTGSRNVERLSVSEAIIARRTIQGLFKVGLDLRLGGRCPG
jgi:hypothetical protein